ncbi:nickel transporter [Undibacterium flavidum]|uniref:Nickel transporter n=1 Tax=Undibacterium flavidum TaxID=2762297 RepID=A0ABR6Y644_9BURK|nr:nickel transporter [Undibacterium flavidum]MBC3872033.1 nickel transporter [Undibacterium flavidum]
MDKELYALIMQCMAEHEIEQPKREKLATTIATRFAEKNRLAEMKSRLAILFEYEKNYLQLVKEFKEEIKFAGSIQEDLRKERAKFFADTLKEVSTTFKESQVEPEVAAVWLKDLVGSYTRSLDLSSGLIEEQTIDTIGKIRGGARKNMKEIENNSEI